MGRMQLVVMCRFMVQIRRMGGRVKLEWKFAETQVAKLVWLTAMTIWKFRCPQTNLRGLQRRAKSIHFLLEIPTRHRVLVPPTKPQWQRQKFQVMSKAAVFRFCRAGFSPTWSSPWTAVWIHFQWPWAGWLKARFWIQLCQSQATPQPSRRFAELACRFEDQFP